MTDTQASITLNAYDRTQAAFRSAMASMEKFRKSAFNLKTALVGVLSGVAIGAGIKSIIDYGDKTAKLADTLKLTTRELQQYRFAGEQSRLTNEELDKGLTRLSKSMGELRIGQGQLHTFLKTADPTFLNTLKNTSNFSEALNLVIQRIGSLKNPTEQAALANAAFGRSFQGFIRLSADGGKVLDNLKNQAISLGIVLSDQFLRRAEKASDEWNIITKIIRAAWANVVDGMLPSLSNLASYLSQNSQQVREFGRALGATLESIGKFVVFIGDASAKARDLWDAMNTGTFGAITNARVNQENLNRVSQKLDSLLLDLINATKLANTAWTQFGETLQRHRINVISEEIKRVTANVEVLKSALQGVKAVMDAMGGLTKNGDQDPEKKFSGALNKKDEGANERKQLQKKLNDMELSFLSEEEKQYVHLSKMKEILREGLEKQLIDRDEYLRRVEDMEERTAENVAKINQRAADKTYKTLLQSEKAYRKMKFDTANMAVGLLQTLGQKSKGAAIAAILLGKAVAIAQTIQNTAAAVMKAYTADPTGALAAKVAFMGKIQLGIIAATGLAEISNLNKGGGGGSIGGGGSPGTSLGNQQEQAKPVSAGKRVVINLGDNDDLISKSAVRKLIEKINQEIKDGATLVTT